MAVPIANSRKSNEEDLFLKTVSTRIGGGSRIKSGAPTVSIISIVNSSYLKRGMLIGTCLFRSLWICVSSEALFHPLFTKREWRSHRVHCKLGIIYWARIFASNAKVFLIWLDHLTLDVCKCLQLQLYQARLDSNESMLFLIDTLSAKICLYITSILFCWLSLIRTSHFLCR
jgi:hypothetical protein